MESFIVSNQKGGVGKTTTAVNIAAAYAAIGLSTLLIDLDQQSHAAVCLGYTEDDASSGGSGALFEDDGRRIAEVTIEARENLYLAIAPRSLTVTALEADARGDALDNLSSYARQIMDSYQIVVIDTPPNLGVLSLAGLRLVKKLLALGSMGGVVVPVATQPLSLKGLGDLLVSFRSIKNLPPLLAVVPTFYSQHRVVARETYGLLVQFLAGRIDVTSPIHEAEKFRSAPNLGSTIFEHNGSGRPAQDYALVAQELVHLARRAADA